jgi:hypothetical protein
MPELSAPFGEGDRVSFTRPGGACPCLVLDIDRDPYGWDVLVLPEAGGGAFWVGDNRLTLLRHA